MNILSYFIFVFLAFNSLMAAEQVETTKKRVLVGSPVRQKPEILKEFFKSLDNVQQKTFTFDYCFVDDNDNPESKQVLQDFCKSHAGHCEILSPDVPAENSIYITGEHGHNWTNELVWKVAAFKDKIIDYAVAKDYDYLFFIDSDIVLDPRTLEQLISDKKGVVCNIFWTSWSPGTMEMPQVWMQDEYNFYEIRNNQRPSAEECAVETYAFMNKLRQPGCYEVGGMGACTLIDKETLKKGVSFKKVKNLSFWGEDRHFCVRAAAKDIPLFVDTHYPAYHIYRESALPGVCGYVEKCLQDIEKTKHARITLSMIIKNEADSYLREVLGDLRQYITDAVVIDDGSTDNSVEVVKEMLTGIPLTLIINDHSKFHFECSLREQQWNETIKTHPDWILNIDADQKFEKSFKDNIQAMADDPCYDVYNFRLYDFWDDSHYREDQYWQAHLTYRPFMMRYKPGTTYTFRQTAQHCGHFPVEVSLEPKAKNVPYRLMHYGWANKKLREEKYARYMKLDPGAKYGWKEQYDSILDENPRLIEWKE